MFETSFTKPNDLAPDSNTFCKISSCLIASDLISSSNESKSNSSPYILLNLETAEFAAI